MSNPNKLLVPIVNINGSNKDDLALQQHEAFLVLGEALDKMVSAGPHGRDFQASPEGDYIKARAQHDARVTAVSKIREEYMALYLAIDKQ